ncbi:MAG: DUF3575 domain-containing protein [Candidatus Anstonellales archaeon]
MKKIFIIFVLSMFYLVLNAQERTEKIYGNEQNTIYVNLIPVFWGQINANYERLLSNKVSLMGGLGAVNGFFYVSTGDNWSILTTLYKVGVGIYPAGRYGKTLRGIYFMPSYTGIIMNFKYNPENKTGSAYGSLIGLDIGHKWIWSGGVMLDLSIGMGYGSEIVAQIEDKKAGKINTRVGITHIGIQFGYAW